MTQKFHKALCGLLAILILAAAQEPKPLDLVRQANQAFQKGEWEQAESLYQQAHEKIQDPGLIAFNKATVLYNLKRYREAETHYRQALSDMEVPPERRLRGLYNLGNCLLQTGETDLNRLRFAISCFEIVLEEASEEMDVHADSLHNIELAKLLWNRARAKASKRPTPNEEPKTDPPPMPESRKKENEPNPNEEGAKEKSPTPKAKMEETKAGADGKKMESKQPPPGAGNLPVLKDEDKLDPLTPSQTQMYLEQAAQRLQKERIHARRGANNGAIHPNDF